MGHTPTPWGLEDIDGENNHQHYKAYALVDSRGKTIMDCLNSEVAMIECDPDFDGSNSWDEQGRQDFEFAKLACNSHDALVEALEHLMRTACRPGDDGKFDDSFDEARNKARIVLASTKGAK